MIGCCIETRHSFPPVYRDELRSNRLVLETSLKRRPKIVRVRLSLDKRNRIPADVALVN